jgi:hypothetical protein
LLEALCACTDPVELRTLAAAAGLSSSAAHAYPAALDKPEHGHYFPRPDSRRFLAGEVVAADRAFENGKFLFKFGKTEHIRETWRIGKVGSILR